MKVEAKREKLEDSQGALPEEPSDGPSGNAALAKQVIQFCLLGAINAGVNYAVYVIAIVLGAHYLLASILGYVISVFNAWFWQYFVIFKEGGAQSDQKWWKALFKTYITYATTGLVLNNILLFLALDVIHVENFMTWAVGLSSQAGISTARDLAELVVPLVIMVVMVPVNFLLNKFWAFGKKDDKKADQ